MAELSTKWVKKQWNRTSSTGKALVKALTPFEKAEAALAKGESRDALAAASGAVKVLSLELKTAEATYAKKKDADMLQHTRELVTLADARGKAITTSQKSYLGRIQTWIKDREDLLKLLDTAQKRYARFVSTAEAHVTDAEKLLKQAQSVAVGSDPAAVIQIKGRIVTLHEDVEGVLHEIQADFEKVKKAIDPVRMQRPDSTGIDLSAKDTKPYEKLWKDVMKSQSVLGGAIEDVTTAVEDVRGAMEATLIALSDADDRTRAYVDLLEKSRKLADDNATKLSARFVSKFEGDIRIYQGWADRELQQAITAGDDTLVANIQKGRGLRRETLKSNAATLRKICAAERKLLRGAISRVPASLHEVPEIATKLREIEVVVARYDDAERQTDQTLKAMKELHTKMEKLRPL